MNQPEEIPPEVKNSKTGNEEEELMSQLLNAEIFSKKSLGVKEEDTKRMYAKAKQLYDSGKYQDARTLFSTLTLISRDTPAFLFGLAASSFMLNDDQAATDAFLHYGTLVPTDPMPYYYLAMCYEKKKEMGSTLIALQTAINRAADQPQYQEVKNRAKMAVENAIRQINSQKEAKQG